MGNSTHDEYDFEVLLSICEFGPLEDFVWLIIMVGVAVFNYAIFLCCLGGVLVVNHHRSEGFIFQLLEVASLLLPLSISPLLSVGGF